LRLHIVSASTLIEGLVSGIVSLVGAYLLTFTSTAYASIIIGIISLFILAILLIYMKDKVGLKPEEYNPKEINFKEIE
jgi:uncharacterized membrane protein